jgi:hypothetical protein
MYNNEYNNLVSKTLYQELSSHAKNKQVYYNF